MESTKLTGIYSNGMVLQRDKEIIIEGFESAKSEVVVTLADSVVTASVTEGRFKAVLPPMDVVFDTVLKVEGTDTIEIKDVCIGDVYMLAGQSNMELPIARVKDRYPALAQIEENPGIRTFKIVEDTDFHGPLAELRSGAWSRVKKDTIMDFSATGYFFLRRGRSSARTEN